MAIRTQVIYKQSSNNLGRTRTSDDGICGFLYYGNIPSGFGTDNVKLIGSVAEAEALGISIAAFPQLHYHIVEFFRIAGNSASLYVGVFFHAGSNAYDYSEIQIMQKIANGTIKQLGYFTTDTLTTGMVNLLQAQVVIQEGLNTPLNIMLTPNVVGITLPDFSTASNYGVSISPDQAGSPLSVGAPIAASTGKTIGSVGVALGGLASIPVHYSLGSTEFVTNIAGNELDVIANGAGILYSSLSDAQVNADIAKGYLKLIKRGGLSGTFFNNDATCAGTGDLNRIHLCRVANKVRRISVGVLSGKLNGVIPTDPADGTITTIAAKSFESILSAPLTSQMLATGELSDFSVFVNPDQTILDDDNLDIEIQCIPNGTNETITVTFGYATSL